VPGFPEFIQTEDQKFVRETFLDCIEAFARTGKPMAEGWPAFGSAPDQGSISNRQKTPEDFRFLNVPSHDAFIGVRGSVFRVFKRRFNLKKVNLLSVFYIFDFFR
jgi:hypothetical protein